MAKPAPNGQLQQVQVEKLHVAAWNPRFIKRARMARLVKSLQDDPEFLKRRPILALPDGTIYARNQRYAAAVKLGWDTVPVIYDDIPVEQAKARALRDNNVYGEWDDAALSEMLQELRDGDIDLSSLGFNDELIAEVLGAPANGEAIDLLKPNEYLEQAHAKWAAKLGELYVIPGSKSGIVHRIICGDCTQPEVMNRLLDGARVGVVFTDPPYGIDYSVRKYASHNQKAVQQRQKGKSLRTLDYSKVEGDAAPFDPTWLFERFDKVKEIFLWGAQNYIELCPDAATGSWIVWDKTGGKEMDFGMTQQFELRWSRHRHKAMIIHWYAQGCYGHNIPNRCHPTQKPLEVTERIVSEWIKQGALILDPYLGSGTTIVAAERHGCSGYGAEIDPQYVSASLQRLADLGLSPERADGK